MEFLRRNIIFKIICVALAFHIFNISVDTPDGHPDYVPEDLTINDQESFVELVLEKCLGFDNAIAEHDEPGDESNQQLELSKEFQLYKQALPVIKFDQPYIEINKALPSITDDLPEYISEITPPPPKA